MGIMLSTSLDRDSNPMKFATATVFFSTPTMVEKIEYFATGASCSVHISKDRGDVSTSTIMHAFAEDGAPMRLVEDPIMLSMLSIPPGHISGGVVFVYVR